MYYLPTFITNIDRCTHYIHVVYSDARTRTKVTINKSVVGPLMGYGLGLFFCPHGTQCISWCHLHSAFSLLLCRAKFNTVGPTVCMLGRSNKLTMWREKAQSQREKAISTVCTFWPVFFLSWHHRTDTTRLTHFISKLFKCVKPRKQNFFFSREKIPVSFFKKIVTKLCRYFFFQHLEFDVRQNISWRHVVDVR